MLDPTTRSVIITDHDGHRLQFTRNAHDGGGEWLMTRDGYHYPTLIETAHVERSITEARTRGWEIWTSNLAFSLKGAGTNAREQDLEDATA